MVSSVKSILGSGFFFGGAFDDGFPIGFRIGPGPPLLCPGGPAGGLIPWGGMRGIGPLLIGHIGPGGPGGPIGPLNGGGPIGPMGPPHICGPGPCGGNIPGGPGGHIIGCGGKNGPGGPGGGGPKGPGL